MNQGVEQAVIVAQASLKPHPVATQIAFFNADGTPFSFGGGGGGDGVSEEFVTDAIATAVDDLASESFVTDAISAAVSGLASTASVTSAISAAVSGLASTASVTSAISAAVSGLASTASVTSAISAAVSGLASTASVTSAISAAVSGLASTASVTSAISAAVSGLASTSYVDTSSAAVTTAFTAADKIIPYLTAKTADWTLNSAAAGGCTPSNKATAISCTIDSSTGWSIGQVGEILTVGAGQTTVVQGSGATVQQASGLKSRLQWTSMFIRCIASNTYVVSGDTTP